MLHFISGGEIIFVFFIILMIFGADKIPEIARGMGKGIRQVRDATQEIKSEIKKSSKNKGIETDKITDDIECAMLRSHVIPSVVKLFFFSFQSPVTEAVPDDKIVVAQTRPRSNTFIRPTHCMES